VALMTMPALRRPTAEFAAGNGGRGAAMAGEAGPAGADGAGATALSGATAGGSLGTMRPSGKRRNGPIGGDAGGKPTPPLRGDSGACAIAHGASAIITHASNIDFFDIFSALRFFRTAVIISPYSDENTGIAVEQSRAFVVRSAQVAGSESRRTHRTSR
jgi:hypothetical protein